MRHPRNNKDRNKQQTPMTKLVGGLCCRLVVSSGRPMIAVLADQVTPVLTVLATLVVLPEKRAPTPTLPRASPGRWTSAATALTVPRALPGMRAPALTGIRGRAAHEMSEGENAATGFSVDLQLLDAGIRMDLQTFDAGTKTRREPRPRGPGPCRERSGHQSQPPARIARGVTVAISG